MWVSWSWKSLKVNDPHQGQWSTYFIWDKQISAGLLNWLITLKWCKIIHLPLYIALKWEYTVMSYFKQCLEMYIWVNMNCRDHTFGQTTTTSSYKMVDGKQTLLMASDLRWKAQINQRKKTSILPSISKHTFSQMFTLPKNQFLIEFVILHSLKRPELLLQTLSRTN